MDRRYQVFVSSTYKDLQQERQEVMHALLELDCIPAGMELFPAANEDQWTHIKKVVDDCDYYIVIVGGRYGSVGPDSDSYTEMEYRYALDAGKPIIAFLHRDPNSLPSEPDLASHQKLTEFRELCQQKMCKFWATSSELGSVVSRSLIKLIKSHPATGWIRADHTSTTSTNDLAFDGNLLREIIQRLTQFQVLDARCSRNVDLRLRIAAYFWNEFSVDLFGDRAFRSLYFGPGASIAYIARELRTNFERAHEPAYIRDLWIRTNNIFVYLDLILSTSLRVDLTPYGPPDMVYGATFGADFDAVPPIPPLYGGKLSKVAQEAASRLSRALRTEPQPTLFLITDSALNLRNDSGHLGPHGDNYRSQLFNRAILMTQQPTVLFFDETEVDTHKFVLGNCHSLCDADLSWEQVCNEFPIALCIGTTNQQTRDLIAESMETHGFELAQARHRPIGDFFGLMGMNDKFVSIIRCSGYD